MQGHRTYKSLHEEFTCEGENDNVEGHKREVFGTFAVIGDIGVVLSMVGDEMVIGWESVGEENGIVKRV